MVGEVNLELLGESVDEAPRVSYRVPTKWILAASLAMVAGAFACVANIGLSESQSTQPSYLRKSAIDIKTYKGNAKGGSCMIPFTYNKVDYFDCTLVEETKPWCPVADPTSPVKGRTKLWGYCVEESRPTLEQQKAAGRVDEPGADKADAEAEAAAIKAAALQAEADKAWAAEKPARDKAAAEKAAAEKVAAAKHPTAATFQNGCVVTFAVQAPEARIYTRFTNQNCNGNKGDHKKNFEGSIIECERKCDEFNCPGFIKLKNGNCYIRGGTELIGRSRTKSNGRDCFVPTEDKGGVVRVDGCEDPSWNGEYTYHSEETIGKGPLWRKEGGKELYKYPKSVGSWRLGRYGAKLYSDQIGAKTEAETAAGEALAEEAADEKAAAEALAKDAADEKAAAEALAKEAADEKAAAEAAVKEAADAKADNGCGKCGKNECLHWADKICMQHIPKEMCVQMGDWCGA